MAFTSRKLALFAVLLLGVPMALGNGGVKPGDVVSVSVREEAERIYGPAIVVRAASVPAFDLAFPSLKLYEVTETGRIPLRAHYMTWSNALGRGNDFTRGFQGVLSDSGVVLSSAEVVARVARAYAEVADPELLPARVVTSSADASVLGYTPANPATTAKLNGWDATLETWIPTNGMRVAWGLDFSVGGVRQASWRVTGVGLGPADFDLEAPFHRVGHELINAYGAQGHTQTGYYNAPTGARSVVLVGAAVEDEAYTPFMTGTNADGTTWEFQYPARLHPVPPDVFELAEAARDGAVWAYDRMVARNDDDCAQGRWNPNVNWTLVVADGDCRYHVEFMDPFAIAYCGGACAFDDSEKDDVHITISPILRAQLTVAGWYLNDTKHDLHAIMRSIMGHELFHGVQNALEVDEAGSRWVGNWKSLSEGTARFIQTLLAPDVEQDPSSPWYVDVNEYLAGKRAYPNGRGFTPKAQFCNHEYRTALFWAQLYQERGLEGILSVQRHADAFDNIGVECVEGIMRALNVTLDGAGSGVNASAAFLHRFVREVYDRGHFAWRPELGGPLEDWSQHLKPVYVATWVSEPGESASTSAHGFGFAFIPLPDHGTYRVRCTSDDPGHVAWRTAQGATITKLDCDNVDRLLVHADGLTDVTFLAPRGQLTQAYMDVFTEIA